MFTPTVNLMAVSQALRTPQPDLQRPDGFQDRRASRRIEVTCEAVIETMTAREVGRLVDISIAGARLVLVDPLPVGSTALLRWAGHEAVCTVVWMDGTNCGISFGKPIAPEIVAQTAELNRVIEMPIAQVGNIAQGQKRSAFRAALRAVASDDS
jgi:hypothetical protein